MAIKEEVAEHRARCKLLQHPFTRQIAMAPSMTRGRWLLPCACVKYDAHNDIHRHQWPYPLLPFHFKSSRPRSGGRFNVDIDRIYRLLPRGPACARALDSYIYRTSFRNMVRPISKEGLYSTKRTGLPTGNRILKKYEDNGQGCHERAPTTSSNQVPFPSLINETTTKMMSCTSALSGLIRR